MAQEAVLIVTVEGDAIPTIMPADDPAMLGQIMLDKLNEGAGQAGYVYTMHVTKGFREIP